MNSNQKSQLSEALSKVLDYSNQPKEQLNKWLAENKKFFDINPVIERSTYEHQNLKVANPFEPINKNLDELNDSSAKTSELMQIMVELLQASNKTNEQMALMIDELAMKQEENNQLTIQFHEEDSAASTASMKNSKESLKSSNIAAYAAVISIFVSIILWALDNFSLISILIDALQG